MRKYGASKSKKALSVKKKFSHRLRARTNHVKLARKERCAAVLRLALVSRTDLEEGAFRIKRMLDWFGHVDITLATIHHGKIVQA